MHTVRIAPDLFLCSRDVHRGAPPVPTRLPKDHLVLLDCSISMSGDLPRIREQLKLKLPRLLHEGDTVSIIWFSGRGQFGTLVRAEPVAGLADLAAVHRAIDRWLKPVGMTGFKEPIEEATRLARDLARPGRAISLFFMSDGCDNVWPRQEILGAASALAPLLAAATVVEYGYYADRALLAQIAEKAGGALIFSEAFHAYEPAFERAVAAEVAGARKVSVPIAGAAPIGGFAFSIAGEEIQTFAVEEGAAMVPEGTAAVYWLAASPPPGSAPTRASDAAAAILGGGAEETAAAYAAISLFSVRAKPEIVWPLLKATGDVRLIDDFASCFGKQRYSAFMEAAKEAAFGRGRLVRGFDPSRVPPEDATTVLDVLRILGEDDATRLLLAHEAFRYDRISRARVDASVALTEAEAAEVASLNDALLAARSDLARAREIHTRIGEILAKPEPLRFVEDPAENGYEFSALAYNEERANVSVTVRKAGKVDLRGRLPAAFVGRIPDPFPTIVWRNYAIVKDGLVNVETLPVRISEATHAKLVAAGAIPSGPYQQDVLLNLRGMPILNRKMAKRVTAAGLFGLEYDLAKARAAQKVYGSYAKERGVVAAGGRASVAFGVLYGEDGAEWLRTAGFSDNGFSPPHTTQAAASDVYRARVLRAGIAGLKTIPSLADVKEKMAKVAADRTGKAKLTPAQGLMAAAVREVEDFIASPAYASAPNKDDLFRTFIEGRQKAAQQTTRRLIAALAEIKMAMIVGGVWPTDLASIDVTEVALTFEGKEYKCTIEMGETEIEI